MEERNVGTKGIKRKQSLTSAKDLTIEISEGHESPYHRLNKIIIIIAKLILTLQLFANVIC